MDTTGLSNPPKMETTSLTSGKKLEDSPIHLGLDATTKSLSKITGAEWYQQYTQNTAADGAEGRLVSMYTFTESWDEWEMHPHGEEAVICTAGEITLLQDVGGGDGKDVMVTILKAGEYAINPKGVWHTASCSAPCSCIFITPGVGTEHKPRSA